MHDTVIRGGTLVDGTGGAPFTGDIAIDGGKLTAIGGKIGPGRRIIDASGLIVTPGFVDVHTHFDGQVLWDAILAPSVWHGISTVIIGNCGVGFAPVRPDQHARLIDIMATVEDIPARALESGLSWNWESYPEYLDAVAARARTIDVGALFPHTPLRLYVMGERACERANPGDIEAMCELVRDAMRAGAVGLGTSRTILHTDTDGVPIPGTTAGEEELTALARAVREGGDGRRGILEVSPPGIAFPEPFTVMQDATMLIRVARNSGCPVVFSLLQSNFHPGEYRAVLVLIEQAQAQGIAIFAEVCARPVSTLLGFQSTFNPFATLPSYAPLLNLPLEHRVAALRDPKLRQRLLSEEDPNPKGLALVFTAAGFWNDVFVMGEPLNYYPRGEDSIQNIADASGRTPKAVAYDAMLERDGRAFLMYVIGNWSARDRVALREMVKSPATVLGLADGGAHITSISDSSQPTTLLTGWVRGRNAEDPDALSLADAVCKLSYANANLFGLADRGALRPGLKADLNLIDLDALRAGTPEMVYDMPLGLPRLDQRAEGYVATIVGGEVVLEQGELTGKLPGRLVRAGA